MLSLARLCKNGPSVRTLMANYAVRCTRNASIRTYTNITGNRNSLVNSAKIRNLIKGGSLQVSLRLKSDASDKSRKTVGYWLLTCSGMVFVAVVLGGVTRLTESGLSMVTWKLLGEKMPRTELEWQSEFEKYQQFPEFKIKNRDMSLSEFKFIWHMEYGHRQWGRLIGAVFAIPATIFWARGMLGKGMKPRVLIYGGLIGAQGLMGWYMVKSGLEDRFHDQSDIPRVSQYRLASHLALAFGLYTLFLWSALDHLLPAQTIQISQQGILKASRKFRMLAHTCKGLVFLTAISGAFVAGLDAGLVYNSFPKMANKWIPDDILALKPNLVNFTENPTTVQFDHRLLGTTTLTAITALFLMSRKRVLPTRAHKAVKVLVSLGWLQVALGITTLLMYVPTGVAALHQSGSLALLSSAIWLTHELKKLPK